MIDEINSTELHTCLLEITLLPLAHYWHFWYGPLDAAIYGSFILGAKILWYKWNSKKNDFILIPEMSSISDRVCGPQPK